MVLGAVERHTRGARPHLCYFHPEGSAQGSHLGLPLPRVQARRDESGVVDRKVVRTGPWQLRDVAARARVHREDHRAVVVELGLLDVPRSSFHPHPAYPDTIC